MMASKPRGTLYTGVTSERVHRIWQHREGEYPGFTSKYRVKMLVWYEEFADIRDAIQREKTIKHWVRQWKIDLVENENPKWEDLWERIVR